MSKSSSSSSSSSTTTSFNLCTPQAVQLLEQALQYCHKWDKEHGEVNSMNYYAHPTLKQEKNDDNDNDDSDNDDNNSIRSNPDDDASQHSNSDGSTTSSSSRNGDESHNNNNNETAALSVSLDKLTMEAQQQQARTNKQQSKSKKYQSIQSLVQQIGTPPTVAFPLLTTTPNDNRNQEIRVPSAFFTKHELRDTPTSKCTHLYHLAKTSPQDPKYIVILLLQSGRFTGAIFDASSPTQKCVIHTTFTKYTQRKKQGKSQSSMDNSKGKANSMGAQLRRAGEVALQQDVQETLEKWKTPYLDQSTCIWVSCPPTMMKQHITDHLPITAKEKVRKIPLNYGKPTFESACAIYQIMMQLHLVNVVVDATTTNVPTITKDQDTTNKNQQPPQEQQSSIISTIQEEQEQDTPPPSLTPLHVAAAEGNVDLLKELLSNSSAKDDIDICAGPEYRTPLHYAAAAKDNASTNNNTNNNNTINAAAECVSLLLLIGHANPSIVDVRNRVPYYDASHETIRNAFRRARHELGEDYLTINMDWDVDAKVGPALSNQDLQQRQQKALEKKKRQRARQKEKKKLEQQQIAQEKLAEETLAQKKLAEQEAKRVRDALPPSQKTTNKTSSMVCDFCQTPQKGKRRSQMFERLGYRYCSTECVQKHKRELMAKAAMERFN